MRKLIIGFVCVVLLLIGGWFAWLKFFQEVPEPEKVVVEIVDEQKEHRLVIFIHGTFGSTLSLLDAPSVVRDNIKGSMYAKTARSMRKDHFFFSTQPLMGRGLVPFIPSFDSKESHGFFAMYPIGKSYELFAKQLGEASELRHYYVFGWSGLLSQHKRRQEAVRFLNALADEVARFKAKGITPKITVVAHSHGGNLVLNAAALVALLRNEAIFDGLAAQALGVKKKLAEILFSLPTKAVAMEKKGQKKGDYELVCPAWNINQFVMLGSPVQPETDFAVQSTFLESVIHCYSVADKVQSSDWVSTSRYYSDQRFDCLQKELHVAGLELPKKLKQVRVMFNREISPSGTFEVKSDAKKEKSWWSLLVGDFAEHVERIDPTHKEFWFLVSRKDEEKTFLKPLPISVCMPLVTQLCESTELCDLDLNIARRADELCFEFSEHNRGTVVGERKISWELFDSMRVHATAWEADAEFLSREESLIFSHLRVGRAS